MKDVSERILPIMWVEEGATIDDIQADMFKDKLISKIETANIVLFTLIGAGIIMIGFAVISMLFSRDEDQPKETELKEKKRLCY